jgi:hypothetical protein
MPKAKKIQQSQENKSVIFYRTGNFWVDNGIVALKKMLDLLNTKDKKELYGLQFESLLHEDGTWLSVSAPSSEMLEKVMNKAKEEIIETYKMKKPDSWGWIYIEHERRFEKYEKETWALAYANFFAGTKGKTEGSLEPKQMTNTQRSLFEEFKAVNPEAKLPDRGFLNSPPKYDLGKPFTAIGIASGKKQCNFSGEEVATLESVTGLNYPFLTGISGGLNFQSNLTGKYQIAPKYAFVSLFAPFNLFYSLQYDVASCYFIPYDSDLFELDAFYNSLNSIKDDEHKQWCNFKKDVSVTNYLNENLLVFLLSIYKHTFKELSRDWRSGRLFPKSIYSFISDGNMFRSVHEFSKVEPLFEFFDKLVNIQGFTSLLWDFREQIQGRNDNTLFRERLAERILEFEPLNDVVEEFLATIGMKREKSHYFISQFIRTYNMEVIKMEKSMVDLCYAIGRAIGEACKPKTSAESGNKGVLFTLRNTKNFTEFLKNLERIQSELQDHQLTYSRRLFDEINEQNWEQYKSLISIFAMGSFLYTPKSEGG